MLRQFVNKVMMAAANLLRYLTYLVIALPVVTFISYKWKNSTSESRKPQKKKIRSPFPSAMREDFEKLVQDLAPSSRFMKEGKKVAESIFEELRRGVGRYGLKIARTKIAGSFKKDTGISYRVETENGEELKNPDLDLIVIVNDTEPPFGNVFQAFEKILENMAEVRSIEVREFTIKLVVASPTQGDIDVDLLAATNLAKNTKELSGKDVGNVAADKAFANLSKRQMEILRDFENSPDSSTQEMYLHNNHLFSSVFAEKTLDEIRLHVNDPFKKKIVMLAKYWNARVKIADPFSPAKSCMIELVAIYAQRKAWRRENRYGEKCVVCGFRRFLKEMKNLRTMNISLDQSMENCSTPMVRDPVNKYNNFAEGLEAEVIATLVDQAEKTLEMLERYRKGDGVSYESVENAIDEIFCHKR